MFMRAGKPFQGRNGTVYSKSAVVDPADVALALKNNWDPADVPAGNALAISLPAGETDDYMPLSFGAGTRRLEITAATGGSSLTGLQNGFDDQRLVVTNVGAAVLALVVDSAKSRDRHRFLAAADVDVAANQSVSLQYSASLKRWLVC